MQRSPVDKRGHRTTASRKVVVAGAIVLCKPGLMLSDSVISKTGPPYIATRTMRVDFTGNSWILFIDSAAPGGNTRDGVCINHIIPGFTSMGGGAPSCGFSRETSSFEGKEKQICTRNQQ